MKAVLISTQPEWCELIARATNPVMYSAIKTVEVRKTRPKLATPFKVYIYCTKDKKKTLWDSKKYDYPYRYIDEKSHNIFDKSLNGKVIGEFVCDDIIVAERGSYCNIPTKKSQIDVFDYLEYANEKTVYGWHISDLVIYDKPKELNEFHKPCEDIKNCLNKNFREAGRCLEKCFDCGNEITRPPQSWCYVEELG